MEAVLGDASLAMSSSPLHMNWRASILSFLLLVSLGAEWLSLSGSALVGGASVPACVMVDEDSDMLDETFSGDRPVEMPDDYMWTPVAPQMADGQWLAGMILSRRATRVGQPGESMRLHRWLCVERC